MHPTFSSLQQLLEFLGDGDNGLLGYVRNVERACGSTSQEVHEQNITMSVLRKRIDDLVKSSAEVDKRWHTATDKYVHESMSLKIVERDLHSTGLELESTKEHHCQLIESLQQHHEAQLLQLQNSIKEVTEENHRLQLKMGRMKETPFGFRSQVWPRRDIHSLSQQGDHARRMRRLVRQVIAARTTTAVQEGNACGPKRKRLCGDVRDQVRTAEVMASLLSKTEFQTLMACPQASSATTTMANEYLQKVRKSVGAQAILQTCDETGITQRGYKSMYKKFKAGANSTATGLRLSCFPNPLSIRQLRLNMNKNLRGLIGDYYCLHSSLEVPSTKKNKAMKPLTLNEHNNFFCDIEAVQQTMVTLYKITPEGRSTHQTVNYTIICFVDWITTMSALLIEFQQYLHLFFVVHSQSAILSTFNFL